MTTTDKAQQAGTQRYVLGVDVGGTNTPFGIVDMEGNILARGAIPTRGHKDAVHWADSLHAAAMKLARETGVADSLVGVGVGAPCANRTTGCIEAATDLPWPSPVPLAQMLSERFALPVAVTNDANAAAAGEMVYGVARGMRNFIMITLGTGVGSGIVCDGHLLSGARGFAGELGHVVVDDNSDRPCGCGRRGCLQTFCSAKGVVTTALRLLAADDTPSLLRSIDDHTLTALDIYEAAMQGDKIAIETYRLTGDVLGRACANFAAFSDPDAIVLFGGVSHAGDLIIKPMREAFDRHTLHLYRGRVKILRSQLGGADAAILGASALAWDTTN